MDLFIVDVIDFVTFHSGFTGPHGDAGPPGDSLSFYSLSTLCFYVIIYISISLYIYSIYIYIYRDDITWRPRFLSLYAGTDPPLTMG